tara:strand:- start:363 stop:545 length:183 start_codon:yes stop_codon:yes gene_type:complete
MLLEITRVSKKVLDKNNTPCRIGFTEDYIREDGVFVKGEVIYTTNEKLFKEFVVGLKVEL